MKLFFSALLLLLLTNLSAQKFQVYNFQQLEPRLHSTSDTIYIINFWAMWCKPCVEELPFFEQAHQNHLKEKVKVLLVSLDFGSKLHQRMNAFLKRKHISAEVVILDDPDGNSWIGKVDPQWDGALPATIIFRNNQRLFLPKKIRHQELDIAIKNLLK